MSKTLVIIALVSITFPACSARAPLVRNDRAEGVALHGSYLRPASATEMEGREARPTRVAPAPATTQPREKWIG